MNKYTFLLAALAFLGLSPSSVHAAAEAGEKPGDAPTAKDDGLKFEDADKLSDKEKDERANAEFQKMREELKIVLGKVEEARTRKDVIRLNCVNEKLTQIKGFITIGEHADVARQENQAKHDPKGVNHEFTKIMIAAQRVAQFRAEAEACAGENPGNEGSEGGVTVVTTEPADLPATTVAAATPAAPVSVTPPPPATASSDQ